MDELVKLVTQKAGISEDQARTAVNVVVNFIKEHLPAPISGQVDAIMKNPSAGSALGGMFGKK